jgi:hypothetical protein
LVETIQPQVVTKNEKYYAIFVVGLGCSEDYDFINSFQKNLISEANYNVDLFCNKSLITGTIKNIGKSLYHSFPSTKSLIKIKNNELKSSSAQNIRIKRNIDKIYPTIIKKLEEGYHILLLGHSYGGDVVLKLAKILVERLNKELLKKIHIATFGTINILSKDKHSYVYDYLDIVNYMHIHDVALKINGLKSPFNIKTQQIKLDNDYNNNFNLVWIKNKKDIYTGNKHESLFSKIIDKEGWKFHISYDDLIKTILHIKNIHLTNKKMQNTNNNNTLFEYNTNILNNIRNSKNLKYNNNLFKDF